MNANETTTITTTTLTREEIEAKIAAAKAEQKAMRALLATLPKPTRPRLSELETREGLFACLWARGLSYHADNGKPLSVDDMRRAVAKWDGEHTEKEQKLANVYATHKLAAARKGKGCGKGKGARSLFRNSPFRAASKAEQKAEKKAAAAREEAERQARAAFAVAGVEATPELLQKAVANLLSLATPF